MTTRRNFLTTSSLAAAAAFGAPWRLHATGWSGLGLIDPPPRRRGRIGDPDLKALAHRALDAATAAGASYAEVRFTVTQQRQVSSNGFPREGRAVAVGVRVLSQGVWGFAADTELTTEMMEWLGQSAVKLGKAGAWPNHRPIDLGERQPVPVGHWQMPVERDPFTASDAEHLDIVRAIADKIEESGAKLALARLNYQRQERTFVSTDGAFATQTVYNTFGSEHGHDSVLSIMVADSPVHPVFYDIPVVQPHGMGLEVFEREKILERIPEWVARARDLLFTQSLPNPGRFEVVFDADAMAAIVSTMGAAFEVDRALGYEANGDGTSYLAPLEKALGTTPFPAAMTITANRTLAGGAATVKWDDEGVVPQDFPVIKDGKLIDYTTSRQFVPELAEWYKAHGLAVRSRGCSGAESALNVPLVQTPNLRLHPGAKDLSFEELLVGIEDGLAFLGGDLNPDQQKLNAMGGHDAMVYTIKKGKLMRGGVIDGARYLIRIPNLWKDLVALGGERSAVTRGFTVQKGQPEQSAVHSVQAVAARFRNVAVRSIKGEVTEGGDLDDIFGPK